MTRKDYQKQWRIANKEYIKEYYKEYGKKWRKNNKEKVKKYIYNWRKNNLNRAREIARNSHYRNKVKTQRKHWKNVVEVLLKYGGRCLCCGEKNLRFLSLDHVNGGGSKHMALIKSRTLYKWAKSNNYPDMLRVLCFNCNLGRQFRGGDKKVCPHNL